ncbi:MAG: hypothetical protein HC769_09185 [Cyanobacteria bacterium CRU_2_1]|nr:hypothetical protein [Cyanobacteria bacterium RU_5_0]NJR59004.1 hypothetical protein [Cyanobacteria bacterium CRU_2_1]
MNSRLDHLLSAPLSAGTLSVSHSDSVIGAAIFDLSGLPKEYFTTNESSDVSWVQTIFQALGLQSLLMSSLRLEGFRHVIVHGRQYRAIVVKQKSRYTAILVCQTHETTSESLIQWAQEFEPNTLKSDPRFSAV